MNDSNELTHNLNTASPATSSNDNNTGKLH